MSVLGEKCDIILYDANDKYVTIGTHFNTKYGITGEKSGSLTGADLLTLFKARDAANYTDATTEITIKKISIYVYTGTTDTVNQLYFAPKLKYSVHSHGSLFPEGKREPSLYCRRCL